MQHLPDHVKRQAMDAVAHRETTDFIRRFRPEDASFDMFSKPLPPQNVEINKGPIPEHVKRLALDAVKNRETTAQIRLMKDDGVIFAPPTPSRETIREAQRISKLHRTGLDVDQVHDQVTRDDF